MASNKRQTGIIYIDKNQVFFYGSSNTNILNFTFPPEIYRNLDIINKEKLNVYVKALVEQNKIILAELTIVISDNSCFIKDFSKEENKAISQDPKNPQPQENIDNTENQIQTFIDNVPLESPSVKIFNFDKGTRVTVANRDLFEALKDAFEKQGFTINIVITATSLFKNGIDLSKGFNFEIAKLVLKKLDSLKQDNLLVKEIKTNQEKAKEDSKKTSIKNPRTAALISVLAILIIVLIVLVIKTLQPSPPKNQTVKTKQTVQTTQPTFTPTPTVQGLQISSNSAVIKEENIKIQIVNGSGKTNQADLIKRQLTSVGFQNIEIGNNTDINASKTLVLFSKDLSPEIKDKFLNKIKETFPEVSVQENTKSTYDIIMITAKNI